MAHLTAQDVWKMFEETNRKFQETDRGFQEIKRILQESAKSLDIQNEKDYVPFLF